MNLKFLGTGTSQGVPVIGCHCEVCRSSDPRDRRFRSSVMVTTDLEEKILIDCGPDFRIQMLQNGEERLDAVLLTHEHNDHVIGLDDLRPIIFRNKKNMNIFCSDRVGNEIKARFPYAFADERYPGAPAFNLHVIAGKFDLFGTEIIPVEVLHHRLPVFGFKIKNMAYITDASLIGPGEMEQLRNLDILVLNCIRKEEEHPAHFILPQALEVFKELNPGKLFLTHISHGMGLHAVTDADLPENVHLAYDGLQLTF